MTATMWDKERAYTRVKLCWFETLDAAYEASTIGADALGFHVFSHNEVEATILRFEGILRYLPPGVDKTLLTDCDLPVVEEICRRIPVDTIQLYPDWQPEVVMQLRSKGFRVLKVMSALPEENKPKSHAAFVERYEPVVDGILLDSYRVGGTGKVSDWALCADIVAHTHVPVFLAGGLTASNVEAAIRAVHPFGVDVETGVSDKIEGGPLVKNLKKCREFVDAVMLTDRALLRGE
jgi:phosphoribosylanthranilate isomerase